MHLDPSPSTFLDLLRWRARHQSDQRAYTFLLDGETAEEHATYGELDRRARAIGALLQERGAKGERVVLLYPPGLDYVASFVGCLYAGAVAVPAYPPDPSRLMRTLPRLQALIADAQPAMALSTSAIVDVIGMLGEQAPDLAALKWLATDAVPAEMAEKLEEIETTSETLAFVQYTSGSTTTPKGVMLTHRNLLHNANAIQHCFEHTPESRGVIWLPPYHDMGLIGGVLQPLFGGFPVVLMSPIDFLKRPLRWLQAISRYRATTSGGPNFAYDLCVRKVTAEDRATLDLSSWDLAFNGAEPIHPETLDRFTKAFEPCGFKRSAFYPCYGLAEATLIVSGGDKSAIPVVRSFDAESLDRGIAVEGSARGSTTGRVKSLVGSGRTLVDQQLVVVDPESRAPRSDGTVGEIWVRGPGITRGYWGRTEETAHAVQASLESGEGPYLRTGDLGFLQSGELFVTGRSKDLIILRGKNHYPQDIEVTSESSHAALRPGCSAAFSVEIDGEERLVVVHEVDRARFTDPGEVVAAIRRTVTEQHEIQPHVVVLVPAGAIPKTSSGKIQRRACRERFLTGGLDPLESSVLTIASGANDSRAGDSGADSGAEGVTRASLLATAADSREALVVASLRTQVAAALGIESKHLDADRPLISMGIDSLKALELANAIEVHFGVDLSMSTLLGGASITELAGHVLRDIARGGAMAEGIASVVRGGALPLSFSQERLFFLDQLHPGQSAYNVAVAVRLAGPLDTFALERSLKTIRSRHEALRTTFDIVDGRSVLVIAPKDARDDGSLAIDATCMDLRTLPSTARAEECARITSSEATKPFDLRTGPVFRAQLVRLQDEEHVLLVTMHHIVSDGWSMGVLVRELSILYAAEHDNVAASLPDLPLQCADFAAWQRRQYDEGAFAPHADYWKQTLAGAPTVSSLKTDTPRALVQTVNGAEHAFSIARATLTSFEAFNRTEGLTPFMTLFTGFVIALHHLSGSDDLVVGTDISTRNHAASEGLIGLWVNQLPLRIDLEGARNFRDVAGRARRVTLDAFAHQALPFDKIVQAVRPERSPSHNPLFQVMFVLENAPVPALTMTGLETEILPSSTVGSPFDLSVLLSPSESGLAGVLRYNTDLFHKATAARLADTFVAVLEIGARDPGASLASLRDELVTRERQRQDTVAGALRAIRLDKFKTVKRQS